MSPLDKLSVGTAPEKKVIVTAEMTVGHVVPGMPAVYGTLMRILHIKMASGSAIQSYLPAGYVKRRHDGQHPHLATTPVGRTIRAIARVAKVKAKSVLFEVEASDGGRKIGDGTNQRSIVNVVEFEKRFA